MRQEPTPHSLCSFYACYFLSCGDATQRPTSVKRISVHNNAIQRDMGQSAVCADTIVFFWVVCHMLQQPGLQTMLVGKMLYCEDEGWRREKWRTSSLGFSLSIVMIRRQRIRDVY